MTTEIAFGIHYIGVDDLDLDLFESQYAVPEGMSYNSFLILDSKITVLDTVDARKTAQWMQNLEAALQGQKPDYLVVHHMEPDHSGSILAFLEKYPDTTIVAGAKALQFLAQFNPGREFPNTLTVKDGDTLPVGEHHTLKFFATPMVHWPEVMMSVELHSGVLFSADAFGKFGALKGDIFDMDDWACEARRYYFNICGKYGPQVTKALNLLLTLSPKTIIAPLHGPVIKDYMPAFLLYNTWSSYGVESEGVFVAYASIHGGTAAVAKKVAEMLEAKGQKVALCDLTRSDRAEAVEDAFRYGTMVLAACSYDAGLFTPAYDFLHSLQMKGWQKRRVALIENGSWAPSAGRVMKEMLGAMKEITLVGDLVTIKSRLRPEDLPALENLVQAVCTNSL